MRTSVYIVEKLCLFHEGSKKSLGIAEKTCYSIVVRTILFHCVSTPRQDGGAGGPAPPSFLPRTHKKIENAGVLGYSIDRLKMFPLRRKRVTYGSEKTS